MINRLAYDKMVQGRYIFGALLRIKEAIRDKWVEIELLMVIRSIIMYPKLIFTAAARVVEVGLHANPVRAWYPSV